MKTLYLLLLLVPLVYSSPSVAQKNKKAERIARLEEQFQATRQLVESQQFKIEINRVFPQKGYDVSRFNPTGHITISDTTAEGRLPFFGEAYSIPYGEGGGIEFNGPMKNRKTEISKKQNIHHILCRFTVAGRNDVYQISLDITPGGSCSIHVSSNNRTLISYSGQVSPLTEESPQK